MNYQKSKISATNRVADFFIKTIICYTVYGFGNNHQILLILMLYINAALCIRCSQFAGKEGRFIFSMG